MDPLFFSIPDLNSRLKPRVTPKVIDCPITINIQVNRNQTAVSLRIVTLKPTDLKEAKLDTEGPCIDRVPRGLPLWSGVGKPGDLRDRPADKISDCSDQGPEIGEICWPDH